MWRGVKLRSKKILKLTALVAIFIGFFVFGAVYSTSGQSVHEAQSSNDVKRVVVQLAGPPLLKKASVKNGDLSNKKLDKVHTMKTELKNEHNNLLKLAKKKGIDVQKRGEFSFAFNGMALEIPKDKVEKLADFPGVKKIYPDYRYHINLEESVPLIGAPDVWSREDGEGRKVTGQSVTVAVLDTGVDYTHSDLGGKFGPGNRVVAGHDFVNNDGDPMDDNGHGTHVAGIVGANGNLTGVAPDATITAYKVLDQEGSGETSTILSGIEEAVDPENPYRADIINMSLSGPGDGNDPLSQASQSAVDAGVVVVAAAGNDGPGAGTIGAPGAASGVLTVGASISGVKVPEMQLVTPKKKRLSVGSEPFSAQPPEEKVMAELIDVGDGKPEDYEGLDVRGKALMMILPSPNNIFERAQFAEEKGAKAVLFYQGSSAGPVSTKNGTAAFGKVDKNETEKKYERHDFSVGASDDGRLDDLIAVDISSSMAAELKFYLSKGSPKLQIRGTDATDKIAAFSSHGPTGAFELKPDLVAPGVDIKSTVPKSLVGSGYMRMSGTSMSAPHTAGAAALLRQLHPDWSGEDIVNVLTESAKPLKSYDPLTQGAGRLDVKAAADANVVASPRRLSFALADLQNENIKNSDSVTLTNRGKYTANIHLSVRDRSSVKANVKLNPSDVTIAPGEQVTVEMKVSLDRPDRDVDVMGWLEGKIETSDTKSHLRIPYHMAARTLQMHTSPDPAIGNSEVFIYSPAELKDAPEVTVYGPNGKEKRISTHHDHDRWWRAKVKPDGPGIYRIQAQAAANNTGETAVTLRGSSTLEILQNNPGTPSWKAVGPNSTGGNFSFDPHNNKKVFALNPNDSSIFISDDKANTWREVRNLPVAGGTPLKLIHHPRNQHHMFLAINGGDGDSTYQGKLLSSNDDGKSWTSLPLPDMKISDLEMNKTGRLFSVIGNGHVYVGSDEGVNWDRITGPWSGNVSDTLLINDDLFLSTDDGLYVVRNLSAGSRTPKQVLQSPEGNSMDYLAGDDNVLLASERYGDLYVSYDQGKRWKKLFGSPSNIQMLRLVDDDIYLSMYGSIWVGENYGRAWEKWETPAPVPQLDAGAVPNTIPEAHRPIYIGSDRVGIFKTVNSGKSYERVGVPGAPIYDVTLTTNDKKPFLLAGTEWDTYRTLLPTQKKVDASTLNWGSSDKEGYFGARAKLITSSPSHPNIVYKIVEVDPVDSFNVFRSEDGGKSWTKLTTGSETPYAMLVHPANPDYIYISYWSLTGSGLLVSHNGGDSWKTISLERPAMALAGDPDNPNRIWAGDETGLYASENGGVTLKKLQDKPVNALSIDPKNPRHLIVGGKELYVSKDGGENLKTSSYANLSFNVSDMIFSHSDSNVAYAATGSFSEGGLRKGGRGVLRTSDGGYTWHNISHKLDNLDVTSLALTPDDKYLFAGTASGGVYRLKLDKTSKR